MDKCFGQHGWKEFYQNRQEILDVYDRTRLKTSNRPVKTAHGPALESHIRKWLEEFLPKKYGVTSGYIIPDLYDDSKPIYHFDIIIYSALESPILWIESNEDQNDRGKFRAIPAKYIKAVFEVKSTLTKRNISDSHKKLKQLEHFYDQLSSNFTCGVIFAELTQKDSNNQNILKQLHNYSELFRFSQTLILRYEGDTTATGIVTISDCLPDQINTPDHITRPLAKRIDDLKIYELEDGSIRTSDPGDGILLVATSQDNYSISKSYNAFFEKDGIVAQISWSRSNFSIFCVELLRELEGLEHTDPDKISFGMIFDSIQTIDTPTQPEHPLPGSPHLMIRTPNTDKNGDNLIQGYNQGSRTINFWIELSNLGEATAIISDDRFKNKIQLPPKKKARKKFEYQCNFKSTRDELNFIKSIKSGYHIDYKLVYHTESEPMKFTAINKRIKIKMNSVEIDKN